MKNTVKHPKTTIAVFLTGVLLITGCTSSKIRDRNLKRVAKDWCMTIRASQVIPIYPLSEDLQPGDVLLVTTPVEEQAKTYEKSGFLALDQHLIRIPLDEEYGTFYNNRYSVSSNTPPLNWQLQDGTTNHNWKSAPASAFPTYTFEVETGAKGSMAIPIEGVPFAMAFMNSSKAEGTVTIANSHTYGVDIVTLYQKLTEWGEANRALLINYTPTEKSWHPLKASTWRHPSTWWGEPEYNHSYLRVITRVHVTGKLNVSISSTKTFKATGAGGADADEERSTAENLLTSTNAAPNHLASTDEATQMTNLNQLVSSMIPGGNATVNTFSSMSVNMDQGFPKPLVIGYIAFDIPILKGGHLGAPISTLSQLSAPVPINIQLEAESLKAKLSAFAPLYHELLRAANEDKKARVIQKELDLLAYKILPDRYPVTIYMALDEPWNMAGEKTGRGFKALLDYIANLDQSIKILKAEQDNPDGDINIKSQYAPSLQAREELQEKIVSVDTSAFNDLIEYVLYD